MQQVGDYELRPALQQYIANHHTVPSCRNYGELLDLLRPELGKHANDPDLWSAAYVPEYERFDTTEKRRNGVEWNQRVAGFKKSQLDETTVWLIRWRNRGWVQGLISEYGYVRRSTDPKALGYGR